MLNVGIIGCGNHAATHASVISSADDGRLVACADVDIERARSFAGRYGIPAAYESLEELAASEGVDLLVIAAFPAAHPDLVERAIEAGVSTILCEKPIALDASRAADLLERAREADALVVEGLMYRHHPQIRRAKELVDDGTVGDVRYVHGQFSDYYSGDPGNWRNDDDLGGGSMTAKGCYMVDACNYFADADAAEAFCRETRDERFDVEIGQTATLVYENGVTAQFETNHRSVWREELKVCGTEGAIVVPHAVVTKSQPRHLEVQLGGAYEHEPRTTERVEFDAQNSYELQFENLVDCVRDEADPVVPLEDSVANLRVTDALLRSAETDRTEPIARSG